MAASTADVTSMPVEVAPVAAANNELMSMEEESVVDADESSELREEVELMEATTSLLTYGSLEEGRRRPAYAPPLRRY